MSKSLETKKLLAGCMKEMMEEKPFSKISVADICEVCQLNRKSFYYHFKDKYELVNWIYYDEFLKDVKNEEFTSVWQLLEELCAYLYANQAFYKHAFKIEGQNSFKDYFTEQLEPLLTKSMERILAENKDREFHVPFYSFALLASLKRWLSDYGQFSADEYLKLLREAARNMALIAEE